MMKIKRNNVIFDVGKIFMEQITKIRQTTLNKKIILKTEPKLN